ncbi:MAG: hypothetical protein GC149_15065 [Gammaproteobacteria bacterium]|nr:hypothetical protein [Gammaproteobacteria bacterium]
MKSAVIENCFELRTTGRGAVAGCLLLLCASQASMAAVAVTTRDECIMNHGTVSPSTLDGKHYSCHYIDENGKPVDVLVTDILRRPPPAKQPPPPKKKLPTDSNVK